MTQKTIRKAVFAGEKITKKGVDEALAAGNTHAKFKNKGVQKRLEKNQKKIRRAQQLRENEINRRTKLMEKVRKAQDKMKAPATAEVVQSGAEALMGLLVKEEPLVLEDADQVGDSTQNMKEMRKAIAAAAILPGSIGGDLVDADFDPANFGVQHVSPEELEAAARAHIGDDEVNRMYPRVIEPIEVTPEMSARINAAIASRPETFTDLDRDIAAISEGSKCAPYSQKHLDAPVEITGTAIETTRGGIGLPVSPAKDIEGTEHMDLDGDVRNGQFYYQGKPVNPEPGSKFTDAHGGNEVIVKIHPPEDEEDNKPQGE